MEKEFLTVYYLKQITDNSFKIEISEDIIPVENKNQFNEFIYGLNRIPQEFELIKWLLKNELYSQAIKFLLSNPLEQIVCFKGLKNYFNNEDIILKKLNPKVDYGELINFYLDFKTNTDRYANYNSHLKQIYQENGVINIPEYKKFILINNYLKSMLIKDDIIDNNFLKNGNVIKIFDYISKKRNVYVTELPIFKHKDYVLSVEDFNFSSYENFIDLIEQNQDSDFIFYKFNDIDSFTTNFPTFFSVRMVQKKRI